MKLPAELGPSISEISDAGSFEGPTPVAVAYPSVIISFFPAEDAELMLFSLPSTDDTPISGPDAKAGGGFRDSGTGNETG